jgi:hypothetical protein
LFYYSWHYSFIKNKCPSIAKEGNAKKAVFGALAMGAFRGLYLYQGVNLCGSLFMMMEEYFSYMAHQEEIIKDHLGDYVVIQGSTVQGYYKILLEALDEMARLDIKPGTFAVRKCRPLGVPDMSVTDIDYQVVPAWTH